MNYYPKQEGELPIGSNDDAVLRMLAGANFGPDAKLILPSGRELDGDEAQAFISAFAPNEDDYDQDWDRPDPLIGKLGDRHVPQPGHIDYNPLDSYWDDDWRGDGTNDGELLVARATIALYAAKARERYYTGTGKEGDGTDRKNNSVEEKRRRTKSFLKRLFRRK